MKEVVNCKGRTFDDLFNDVFGNWTDQDPPSVYLAATLSGRPMFRDLFGHEANSWAAVIPSVVMPVVLDPIIYSTQGSRYGNAGSRYIRYAR